MNLCSSVSRIAFIFAMVMFIHGREVEAQTIPSDGKGISPRQQVLKDRASYVIDSIAEADFDDLVGRISEYDGEYFNLVSSSAMQPSAVGLPWVPMRAVLNDRRVSKLYQQLSEMPRDRAASKISSVYREKLEKFKADWEQLLNGKSPEGRLDEPRRHGLAAALFLCLEFSEETQFDQHIRSWMDWYQSNRQTSRTYARRAGPDELMVVNLYAIALAKRGESMTDIDLRVQQMCDEVGLGRLPELRLHKFVKWKATAADREDPDAVLAEYPVFWNWGSARQLAPLDDLGFEVSRSAMSTARRWVRPAGPIVQWFESRWQQFVEWTTSWFR